MSDVHHCKQKAAYTFCAVLLQTNHKEQYDSSKKTAAKPLPANAKGQMTITFEKVKSPDVSVPKYATAHPRQAAITDSLLSLIADSMLPLQFVESSGFKQFMHVVEPKYNIPSRRTITRKLSDRLQECKDDIKSALDVLANSELRTGTIHATVDLWSSRALEAIIGVRIHFFDEQFSLRMKTIAYRHFGERHTGENIAHEFESIIDEYGIPISEMGYQVTDNASNMLKAFQLFAEHAAEFENSSSEANDEDEDDFLEILDGDENQPENSSTTLVMGLGSRHLPCCAHTLQLVVKDALKSDEVARNIIQEANSVVTFFRRSLFWNEELKKSSGGLTLLAAVPTRWNSSYTMLKRLAQDDVWKAVTDTLSRARAARPSITKVPRLVTSKSQVTELISLLEPFDEATLALQGDGVTASLVVPAMLGLDAELASCKTQLIQLRQSLRLCLKERFQKLILSPEYVVATLLDSRYKLVPFQEQSESASGSDRDDSQYLQSMCRTEAKGILLQMMAALGKDSPGSGTVHLQDSSTESTTTELYSQNMRRSIFAKFSGSHTVCEPEEQSYLMAPTTEQDVLPGEFWAKSAHTYPQLVKLARTFLSIPASSGSVERLFSVAGAIVRARRSRLSSVTVESLLLAMENHKLE